MSAPHEWLPHGVPGRPKPGGSALWKCARCGVLVPVTGLLPPDPHHRTARHGIGQGLDCDGLLVRSVQDS